MVSILPRAKTTLSKTPAPVSCSKSILHLDGRELDYSSGLMQSGFVFNNPNVKGCGRSFRPEPARIFMDSGETMPEMTTQPARKRN